MQAVRHAENFVDSRFPSERLTNMKAILLIFALAFCGTLLRADDWKTTDGIIYKDVKVMRVQDDALTIIYADGGALVPLAKLPPEVQKKYGYDPVKAKAAADARVMADAANAKALQAEMQQADKQKRAQQIKDAQSQTNAAPR